MHFALLAVALLRQDYSTPQGRDTVGYWQQRADYRVVAELDERRGVLRAVGTLTYRNNSPDTLREMFVHQHLNAFRPASAWSRRDEREGRERFQRLPDPHHAYERFAATPTFDGAPVAPEYPGAPDSTVARFRLPRALAPGDSVQVRFAWEARPSTLPRRQGRRGRTFDFAQWYPKVAVYDRRGWEPNALIPAGEFYGEFGDWDVTLVVPQDQVIGSTGVPVEGDPGWVRAARWGLVRPGGGAYGPPPPPERSGPAPAGMKVVRFVARGVHHFAFSLSPDYRYEGGTYVRAAAPAPGELRAAPFDTVSVHVLYKPGDEREWGGGVVVERTRNTLAWLERVYGAYAYPQMTVLHRIEGGGTEFPMMQMNGSPSQGLNLHEGGHIYSYGLLANNEWRAGWMDEGLTSYQTSWAQGLTRADRARRAAGLPPPPLAAPEPRTARDTFYLPAYRAQALRPTPPERTAIEQHRLALLRRMQPIGTRADSFSEFGVYNAAVYTRAEMMYGALRDAIGDAAFERFLRDYYARWALRHVDESAMRGSAERACACDLGWFFRQWVHRVGVIDYALRRVRTERRGDKYVTRARLVRVGDYLHPMPIGLRHGDRWTIVRADPAKRDQTLEIETATAPDEVRLDPLRTTEDWFRPNDVTPAWRLFDRRRETLRLERPLLSDTLADRFVTTVLPFAWYSTPGGFTPAVRLRSSYQGWARKFEGGIGVATRGLETPLDNHLPDRVQYWVVTRDTLVGRRHGPPYNVGAWWLDGATRFRAWRGFDRSTIVMAPRARRGGVVATLDGIADGDALDTLRWGSASFEASLGVWGEIARVDTMTRAWRLDLAGGVGEQEVSRTRGFYRVEYEGRAWKRAGAGRVATRGRVYAAATPSRTPPERRVYASSQRPFEIFGNHYLRAQGAPLAPSDPTDSRRALGDWFSQLGGAGLRGYHQLVSVDRVAAANGEVALALLRTGPPARPLRLEVGAFADVAAADGVRLNGALGTLATPSDERVLADAGVGLAVRGWLFARDVRLRVDLPLYVRQPALAVGARAGERAERVRPRVALSLADLW